MLELHWEHWFGFMQRRLNFVFGVEHIGLQSFAQYRKFLRWIQWISVHIGADLFHMPGAPGTSSAIGHPAETKSNSCCIWSSVRPRWQSIWFFRPPQADLENGPKPIYLYIHNYYIITVNYIYIHIISSFIFTSFPCLVWWTSIPSAPSCEKHLRTAKPQPKILPQRQRSPRECLNELHPHALSCSCFSY
jgi:hypothetical protein